MASDSVPISVNSALIKELKAGLRPLSILYSTSVQLAQEFEKSLAAEAVPESVPLRELKILIEILGERIYELNKLSVSSDTSELKRGIELLSQPLEIKRRKVFIHHLVYPDELSELPTKIPLAKLPQHLDGLFFKLSPKMQARFRAQKRA